MVVVRPQKHASVWRPTWSGSRKTTHECSKVISYTYHRSSTALNQLFNAAARFWSQPRRIPEGIFDQSLLDIPDLLAEEFREKNACLSRSPSRHQSEPIGQLVSDRERSTWDCNKVLGRVVYEGSRVASTLQPHQGLGIFVFVRSHVMKTATTL